MEQFLPDEITVEVKWQGSDRPCRLSLLRAVDIPVASAELDLSALAQAYQRLTQDEMLDHGQYGQALFNLLFPETIRNEFFRLLGRAGERSVRLTLNLDPQIPGLHTIPWERIHFPKSNALFPLATEASVVFSRLLVTEHPEATPKSRGCFRALLALANPFPDTGEPDSLHFDEAAERRKIVSALEANSDKVTWDELPKPVTLEALLTALEGAEQAYDLLYFSGHGYWERSNRPGQADAGLESGEAFLIFDRQDGAPDKVSLSAFMQRLDRTLEKKRLPGLIFLSACHTAIKANTRTALLGFAPRLVQAGCPAVICMQESIEEPVARSFGSKFFAELFEHGCIDLAVNRARAAVYEAHTWQWSIPVLFMHTQDGMLFWPQERFQELLSKPYKYLTPFKRQDAALFKGREREIQSVLHAVAEQRLAVVHGPDGIGLTSLMEAGVCPRLDQADTLVVILSEYLDLAGMLRNGLRASRLHIYLPARDYLTPRQVLDDATGACLRRGVNRLLLVLDQFERALRLPAEQQAGLRAALVDLLEQAPLLRLVIVVHDNWRDALEAWQEQLPDLVGSRIQVGPLLADQVVELVSTPLVSNRFPVKQIEAGLASRLLPNDLANIYKEAGYGAPGTQADDTQPVDAAQLQIVCDWLYRQAVALGKPIIEPGLYTQAGRADGILARTMADTLEWDFAAEHVPTRDVLVSIAGQVNQRWVAAALIAPKILDRDQVARILERLVDFELLDCYRTAGTSYYAFANQSVKRMALEMGGTELQLLFQAEGEIERIWRMWWVAQLRRESSSPDTLTVQPPASESRALATLEQLRTLNETAGHLHPDNTRILLLLRSAIHHDEPGDLWLRWLKEAPDLLGLLQTLETGQPGTPIENSEHAETRQAVLLLGLRHLPVPETLPAQAGEFGLLAWSAVSHPHPTSRQVSALALALAFPDDYTPRLEKALSAWTTLPEGHAPPRWRRAELHGSLLDAGLTLPGGEGHGAGKDFSTWAWRFRRRLARHSRRLTVMLVGSALGMASVLGGWYFLLNLLAWTNQTGPNLPLYAFLGAMLGAVTALGIGLAEPVLLEDSREPELFPPQWSQVLRHAWLPYGLGVLFGTLAFGLTHALLVIVVSFPQPPAWHMLLLGFIAGLGVSLGLYAQPRAGLKLGWRGWLPRLGAAALLLAAIQWVPCLAGDAEWIGTNFTFSAAKFESLFMRYAWIDQLFSPTACQAGPGLQGWLAVLNAALLGILLSLGSTFGMDAALRKLAEWRRRKQDDDTGGTQ